MRFDLQKFFIIISMAMFLFVNTGGATGIEILIPHIEGLVIYWHVVFFILVFAILLIKNNAKIRIDNVSKCLLLKCGIDLISYILNMNTVAEGYFGYFACSITAFLSYIVFSQMDCDPKEYYKIFLIWGVMISLQVFWTFSLSGLNYLDLYYKGSMNIPYGASNVIASALTPLIVLPFFMNMKKIPTIFFSVIIIGGVIMTKSRGGMMLSVVAIIVAVLFTGLIKEHKALKRILVVILVIVILMIIVDNPDVETLLMGYSSSGSGLDALTSGRLGIFLSDFLAFFDKPLFGHGLGLGGTNVSGTHNILIDLLYKCGIFGFVAYVAALIGIWRKKRDSYFTFFVLIMFINSMFEVCYFSYKCDTIFWCAAGLMVSEKANREEIQMQKI